MRFLRFLRLLRFPPRVLAFIPGPLFGVGELGTGDQTELSDDPREDPAFDSFLPKDVTAPDSPVFPEDPVFIELEEFVLIYFSISVG